MKLHIDRWKGLIVCRGLKGKKIEPWRVNRRQLTVPYVGGDKVLDKNNGDKNKGEQNISTKW